MLLAVPGSSFSILDLIHPSLENKLSESRGSCSCFAFRGALSSWVCKGTFGETGSRVTLSFSAFDCCLLQKWTVVLPANASAISHMLYKGTVLVNKGGKHNSNSG